MTIKKATDLPAADSNGLSDPYVRMTLDEKKKKSSIQRKTLSPTWNEKHEWLHVRPGTPTSPPLNNRESPILESFLDAAFSESC